MILAITYEKSYLLKNQTSHSDVYLIVSSEYKIQEHLSNFPLKHVILFINLQELVKQQTKPLPLSGKKACHLQIEVILNQKLFSKEKRKIEKRKEKKRKRKYTGQGSRKDLNSIGPCTTEGGNDKGKDDGLSKFTKLYQVNSICARYISTLNAYKKIAMNTFFVTYLS